MPRNATTASRSAAAANKLQELREAIRELAAEDRRLVAEREKLMQQREAIEIKVRTKAEAVTAAHAAIDQISERWLATDGHKRLALFGSHGADDRSMQEALSWLLHGEGPALGRDGFIALLAPQLKAGIAQRINEMPWPEEVSAGDREKELAGLDRGIECIDEQRAEIQSAINDAGLTVEPVDLAPLPPEPEVQRPEPWKTNEPMVLRATPYNPDDELMPRPPEKTQAESVRTLESDIA
jgi:hypothetical protein